jgi:TolA-binding protein
MDRQHRRDLKHDRFVDELGVLSGKAKDNQRLLLLIGAAAVAIAVVVYGWYFFRSTRERKAQTLLATAVETIEAPVSTPETPNPAAKFKSEAERNATAEKQFKDVKSQYGGTDAGDVADIYLARLSAARGDTAGARKMLESFIGAHPKHLLVGAARYSLYQLRIDNGEAAQVVKELDAELSKQDTVLPADSLLVLLAHAYDVQGNAQKARDTYRRIVTEFPDSPFALDAQRHVGPA